MSAVEIPPVPLHGAQLWPLSVPAYRALLGEAEPDPQKTLNSCMDWFTQKCPSHRWIPFLVASPAAPAWSRLFHRGALCARKNNQSRVPDSVEPGAGYFRRSWNGESDFIADHPHTADFVVEVCVTSRDYDRSKFRAVRFGGREANVGSCSARKQIRVKSTSLAAERRPIYWNLRCPWSGRQSK